MGTRFIHWRGKDNRTPKTLPELTDVLLSNRKFQPARHLDYGDYGLLDAAHTIHKAILDNKRIALYADYDVDGTMSCVSWIWFFRAIGFTNFTYYIPCRFKEGYGVNIQAIKHLIHDEKADVIITMDTGITANLEASYCREHKVDFICTDHHQVQPEQMPHCILVNPKLHPDANYQDLCGCGITFVLLRKLSTHFNVPNALWTDLLAITGIATVCDLVPLSPVNHHLAQLGMRSITKSERAVLKQMLKQALLSRPNLIDEKDVAFHLGPRINAVGRLGHADSVVRAFIEEDIAPLLEHMEKCNQERRQIQDGIVNEARELAASNKDSPIIFLGGDWHPGVVGIASSKMVEEFWKPTWLFQRKDGVAKGSARSIKGFNITEAMGVAKRLFIKYGGHAGAGGFTFMVDRENEIRESLIAFATQQQAATPMLWQSHIDYDCPLPLELLTNDLLGCLDGLRPYGIGFEEPTFLVESKIAGFDHYKDKTTGQPKHTAIFLKSANSGQKKVMFFGQVIPLDAMFCGKFVVRVEKNTFNGRTSAVLKGVDWELGQ